jgi:DNA-binding Lrp family transcriptional regulator
MNNVSHEAYRQKLQEIAAEYEARGYEVLVEPRPEQLPEFLAGFRPDLVARGLNDSVVVEVKVGTQTAASERFRELAETIQRQPGWRFSLVVIDPRSDEVAPPTQQLLDRQEIGDRLGRANALLKTGATDAAFLLMWVSVEALLRHIATREGLPLERVPSSSLMKELFSLGILSRSELEVAQRAFSVRNALVHGFATTRLDETSRELAQFAQKLLLELDRSQE